MDGKYIKCTKLLEIILYILYISIMLNGQNILQYGTMKRGIVIVLVLLALVLMRHAMILFYDNTQVWIMLFLIWVGSSLLWTADRGSSLTYIINYLYLFFIIFVLLPQDYIGNILKISEKVCFVYACSIFLALILGGNIFMKLFSWVSVTPNLVAKEFTEGVYSGFVGDKSQAAFVMNIGYGLVLARCYSKKKIDKKDILQLIVYFLATLLTGKRTLSLVMIFLTLVFFLMSDIKYKYIKVIGLVLLGGITMMILIQVFPVFSVMFERFAMQSESGDILNGRASFWECCVKMFQSKTVTGYGIASFNKVFSASYFEWTNHAHNIYYQIIAELGIVGAVLFGIINIKVFYRIKKLHANRESISNQDVFFLAFGVYMILLFLIYGFTGNPMYNGNQLIWYVFGIDAVLLAYRNLRKGGINEKSRNIDVSQSN